MKVKLKTNVTYNGKSHLKGKTIDMEKKDATSLISRGYVEEIEVKASSSTPAKTTPAKTTPVEPAETEVSEAPAKKPVAKKTEAKKTTAKKAAVKKPTVKKAPVNATANK